jgi:hypothetical protein
MRHLKLISVISIVTLTGACAAETAPPDQPLDGSGGSSSSMAGGSDAAGGSGAQGGGPDVPIDYLPHVGAAYKNEGDARVVLIDISGTRTAVYNPSTGAFESPDDIDELEGGVPLDNVVAAGTVGSDTYFFDQDGLVTVYHRDQATFSEPDSIDEVLEGSPFAKVGGALGTGVQLFVFNEGGTSYAAYNTTTKGWSPIYNFATDFGGGGAPIASVGAAYDDGNGGYLLFDTSGQKYCIFSNGGVFSDDFDIDELGNGSLTFND